MQLGFVGAGRIGAPMIGRLAAAGHDVRVLVRSQAARQAVTDLGATPVTGLTEVADGAAAVVVCVLSDGQVREVALDGGLLDALPAGSVLVSHTTGSPRTIEDLAGRGAPRDVEVVDAPVSGSPQDVAAGHVTLYVGATDAGIERARPVLEAYAEPLLHLGPRGSGQRVKLLNNAIFAANIGVVAQAVRTAAELGLDERAVLQGITHGSGTSYALQAMAAGGSVEAFARAAGEFVGKDVGVVNRVMAELGVDLGEMRPAHRLLGELMAPEHRALMQA
ncbi:MULTISPECIES: NAD(P)-dependent oxidoreductase [unclassified Blastococcus]